MVAGIDETRFPDEDALTYVKRLAQNKADVVAQKKEGRLVLGADTVVVIAGEILGQPRDPEDAGRMLRQLSGRWHEVLTGVALIRKGNGACSMVAHESTRVHFAELTEEELAWYVSTGEPMDKAGAYAIQGRAATLIKELEGDYFNVVGLPIRLVYELLRKLESQSI